MTKGHYVTFRNRSETRIQVMPGSLCLTMWPLKASCYTVRKTSKPPRKDPEERNGPQLNSLSIWIAMLPAIWGSHPATGLSALSWCVLCDTEQNWGKVSCLSPAQITNIVLLSLLLILVARYQNWQPTQKEPTRKGFAGPSANGKWQLIGRWQQRSILLVQSASCTHW